MIPIPTFLIRWLIMALAMAALFGFGWLKGSDHAKTELEQYRAQVAQQVAANQAVAAHVAQEQQKTTQEIDNAYQKKLADVHAYYRWLLARAASPATVSAVSQSAGKPNGAPADAVLDPQPVGASPVIPDDALRLADDCSATTVQLVSLQGWVADMERITLTPSPSLAPSEYPR